MLSVVGELIGFPRHLSQHVGGMVMTRGPLCEMVPIENAAMADRTVVQWDKDDLEALGILKVDCLALGMLTAIRKCFDLLERHTARKQWTLATLPAEGPGGVRHDLPRPTRWACSRSRAGRRCRCSPGCGRGASTTW